MSQLSSPTNPQPEWHVLSCGERLGPFTRDELRTRLETHPEGWSASVWRPGMIDWRAAEGVTALTAKTAPLEEPQAQAEGSQLVEPRRVEPPAPRNTAGELRVLSYATLKALPRSLKTLAETPAAPKIEALTPELSSEWAAVMTSELRAIATSELPVLVGPAPTETSEWAAVATSELRAIPSSEFSVTPHLPIPVAAAPSRTPLFVLAALIVLSAVALGTSLTLRLLRAYEASAAQARSAPRPPPLPAWPLRLAAPPAALQAPAEPAADVAVVNAALPSEPQQAQHAHTRAAKREAEGDRSRSAASRLSSVRVSAASAPVRVGNDSETPIVCSLPRGTVAPVLAELPDAHSRWFAVRCGAQAVGWVQDKYLGPLSH